MAIREPKRLLRAIAAHPWAILEEKGAEIWELLELRSRGELRSDADIEAALRGQREKMVGQSGGIMVIPVFGVLAHRMSSIRESSGGTSVEKLSARLERAIGSEDVGTIVLQVDSPGGSVYGIQELAEKIFEARGKKRIIAVVDPEMASGAYWLGSAADEVVVTPSGRIGSIGVISVHAEFSRMEDAAGVTVTIVRSGRYKAESNPHEPLTEEARAHLQQTTDDYYDLFVDAVARHRGVSAQAVRDGMGEGRVLTAERAVTEGLADRVASLEQVLEELGVQPASLSDMRAATEETPVEDLAPAAGSGVRVVSVEELLARCQRTRVGARPPTLMQTEQESAKDDDPPSGEERASTPEAEHTNENEADADGDAAAMQDEPPDTTAPEARETAMPKRKTDGTGPQSGADQDGGGTAVSDVNDQQVERTRASQISDLCAAVGIPSRAGEYIDSGLSVPEVREKVRAEAEEGLHRMTASAVEMDDREVRRYSLSRAIMAVAEKGEGWDGFERDVSDEIRSKLPKNYDDHGGIFVPIRRSAVQSDHIGRRDLLISRLQAMVQAQAMPVITRARLLSQLDQMQAALDTGTATAGQELMFTEAGEFIDLLRARMKLAQLGATILTGLQGNVAFPKQDGAGTFSWVSEDPGADLADSDLTLAQVALNAKTGMSTTAYSRQLLAQGVVDVDNLVKNDLALITALGIDLAGINGAGGDEPTGVLGTAGIGDVDIGANGGAPTYDHMVDLETDVATANADIGVMAYLTTPGVRGKLKKTEEFSGSNGRPVWTGGMEGEANGYPAHVSTQVPSDLTDGTGTNLHAILFGVWSQIVIGYWGAYELVVDPYSKKKQALIELTSYQQAGIAVRHPESFSAVQDADPTA